MAELNNVIIETMGEQIAGLERRVTELEALLEAYHTDILERMVQTKIMLVALKLATGAPEDMTPYIEQAESKVIAAIMSGGLLGPTISN